MLTHSQRRQHAGVQAPRVVLDTNVVLSALVFARGIAAQLSVQWQAGRCVPRASKATVQELVRVLAYPKFRLDAAVQQELLAGDLSHVRVVSMPQPLPVVHDCRDALRCCCWLASPACGLGSRATNALRKCPGLA